MQGDRLGALKQRFQLNDNIVRMLFVRVDPRIVDTLVAHALAGPAAMAAERRAAEAREAALAAAVAPGGAHGEAAPAEAE